MIDLNLNDESTILIDNIDIYLQEIDILFNTNYTDVLGSPTIGSNFENYLFDLTVSASEIEDAVVSVLSDCISYDKFDTSVAVDIIKGTEGDIIFLSIDINDNTPEKNFIINKTYKII